MSRKPSIKSRLITGYLGLIGVAFLAVFVVFNISVRQYIESSAEQEILQASQMFLRDGFRDRGAPNDGAGALRAQRWDRPPNPIGAEAKVFIWSDGEVSAADPRSEEDAQELQEEIAESIDIDEAAHAVQTVTTDDGTFLVYAIEMQAGDNRAAIVYVDVTDMQNFARNINMLLVIILVIIGGAAVAVSIALASSIVKPFQQLADFARKLGDNDFTPSTLQFRDREPSELLAVMNHTAEKLQAYDSDQKTFFQNVSHELKTPLMTIRCNAEGTAFRVMDADKSARTIMQETDRLGEMIDDLIYISKADTITTSEVLEECDVREILSNCVESQRAAAEKRNIEVICDFANTPVVREVSEKSLQRALSNLVSNAIRYARSKVVLTCAGKDGRAVATVWNDGPEIAPSDLPHIFERFYKGPGGQSGIGLSIVKSVIEKHGGSVAVETSADGTMFSAEF